jgi:hypothetical protein
MASCVTGAGYVRKATFLSGNSSAIGLVTVPGGYLCCGGQSCCRSFCAAVAS